MYRCTDVSNLYILLFASPLVEFSHCDVKGDSSEDPSPTLNPSPEPPKGKVHVFEILHLRFFYKVFSNNMYSFPRRV